MAGTSSQQPGPSRCKPELGLTDNHQSRFPRTDERPIRDSVAIEYESWLHVRRSSAVGVGDGSRRRNTRLARRPTRARLPNAAVAAMPGGFHKIERSPRDCDALCLARARPQTPPGEAFLSETPALQVGARQGTHTHWRRRLVLFRDGTGLFARSHVAAH